MENYKEQLLTVEYALTRREIVRFFLRSLAASTKYQRCITLYCVAFGLIAVLPRVISSRSLTLLDAITAGAFAVGFLVFVSLGMLVTGKTAKRTLSVSSDGISTVIARQNLKLAWNKISTVTETPKFILIAGKNGNAFFIPDRAFSGVEHRQRFVAQISGWMKAAT